jgi:DNA-binding PadR family transcriptional regulator
MTTTTRMVLAALLDGCAYGYAITEQTGLQSGTVIPILHRLEAHGWVAVDWETLQPAGRPKRRYYRLTAEAAEVVTAMQSVRAAS